MENKTLIPILVSSIRYNTNYGSHSSKVAGRKEISFSCPELPAVFDDFTPEKDYIIVSWTVKKMV